MNAPEIPPFAPGARYENRRGLYEVISIDGDSMRIRWDTREEANTSLALQRKILANMDREFTEATEQKRGRVPRAFGEFFRGLDAQDFANDVTGTHWRSREQLGGAVTRLLEVEEPFNSWSIYGRPEVHWASIARYPVHHPSLQTKFFVQINPEQILFGLYVERSEKSTDNQDDWIRFLGWCDNSQNVRWLHEALRQSGSVLTNPYEGAPDLSFNGTIEPVSDGFSWTRAGERTVFAVDKLPTVLRSLPSDLSLNTILGRTLGRDAAVAEGAAIALTIAELFNALLPVYQNTSPTTGATDREST